MYLCMMYWHNERIGSISVKTIRVRNGMDMAHYRSFVCARAVRMPFIRIVDVA